MITRVGGSSAVLLAVVTKLQRVVRSRRDYASPLCVVAYNRCYDQGPALDSYRVGGHESPRIPRRLGFASFLPGA